jgi:hypothetical protein
MVKVVNAGTAVAVGTWSKTARNRSIRIKSRQIRRNTMQMEEEVMKVVAMEVVVVDVGGTCKVL